MPSPPVFDPAFFKRLAGMQGAEPLAGRRIVNLSVVISGKLWYAVSLEDYW